MVNEPSENARPEASRNGKDDGTAPDYSGGAALPLVLFDRNGKIADIGLMNEKGFRKSIERGTLWVVNVETGRLLPYREGSSFTGLVKTERWYSAVLHDETNARTASEDAAASGTAPGPRPDLERPEMSPAENQAAADASVLSELAELLKIRKSELPEGSYTAHLFRSGPDKIRKKLGEEAVELILAGTRDEVIYEAADLAYHLLVLLTALEIDVNEIFAELRKRR
jgi:phosphoribosyl-ATP pyrophosphohydrolase/phosphoribosyl-AMP cyclohydrolase